MKTWPLRKRVGILGGGQLARLLAQSAQNLGFEVHVFCQKADEPAAQVTSFVQLGDSKSPQDLRSFFSKVDVITFESEFMNMDLIEKAAQDFPKVEIFPRLPLMRALQDRRSQKQTLEKFKVPTANFLVLNEASELEMAFQKFDGNFVLKKAQGGYDGFGTFYVKSFEDLEFRKKNWPGPCLAEAFVPFKRELAVSAACFENKIVFTALVESKQSSSRCDWVLGPTQHRDWPRMQKRLHKMLRTLQYRGIIAFEFFDSKGGLLVNEIAPRVHNSAHASIEAWSHSQFELHWRAGLNLEVPKLTLRDKFFVMTNLIGESNDEFVFPSQLAGSLHWYGKTENRPGRKMGHLTYLGKKGPELLKFALKERKGIRK